MLNRRNSYVTKVLPLPTEEHHEITFISLGIYTYIPWLLPPLGGQPTLRRTKRGVTIFAHQGTHTHPNLHISILTLMASHNLLLLNRVFSLSLSLSLSLCHIYIYMIWIGSVYYHPYVGLWVSSFLLPFSTPLKHYHFISCPRILGHLGGGGRLTVYQPTHFDSKSHFLSVFFCLTKSSRVGYISLLPSLHLQMQNHSHEGTLILTSSSSSSFPMLCGVDVSGQ